MPEGCHEVEVLVLVDENGDYGVGDDPELARDNYEERIGVLPALTRLIRVRLLIPEVKATELTGEVPAQGGITGTLTSL